MLQETWFDPSLRTSENFVFPDNHIDGCATMETKKWLLGFIGPTSHRTSASFRQTCIEPHLHQSRNHRLMHRSVELFTVPLAPKFHRRIITGDNDAVSDLLVVKDRPTTCLALNPRKPPQVGVPERIVGALKILDRLKITQRKRRLRPIVQAD
jgi:hypothetical protein